MAYGIEFILYILYFFLKKILFNVQWSYDSKNNHEWEL